MISECRTKFPISCDVVKHGITVVFRPPYSPHLSPIGSCWDWMKDYVENDLGLEEKVGYVRLREYVKAAWEALPGSYVSTGVIGYNARKMPGGDRCQSCIQSGIFPVVNMIERRRWIRTSWRFGAVIQPLFKFTDQTTVTRTFRPFISTFSRQNTLAPTSMARGPWTHGFPSHKSPEPIRPSTKWLRRLR